MSLKNILLGAFVAATATSLFAADAKDEVTKAAKALAEKENYSWKTTVTVPEGTQFRPGPTEGKTAKDGTMYVQAGGGVVADSVPEAEYQETINKSRALFAAAEEAVRFASAAKKGQ